MPISLKLRHCEKVTIFEKISPTQIFSNFCGLLCRCFNPDRQSLISNWSSKFPPLVLPCWLNSKDVLRLLVSSWQFSPIGVATAQLDRIIFGGENLCFYLLSVPTWVFAGFFWIVYATTTVQQIPRATLVFCDTII